MERITPERMAALKASNIPHATPADLTDHEGVRSDPDVTAYLHHYAKPNGDLCVACEASHSFTWGLTHGQGHCIQCGWPATLYHFVHDKDGKEVAVVRGVLLWAHPDEVEFTKPEGTK